MAWEGANRMNEFVLFAQGSGVDYLAVPKVLPAPHITTPDVTRPPDSGARVVTSIFLPIRLEY
jgi:hypothetical protein